MSAADRLDVLFDGRHVDSSGIGSYTRELLHHLPAWATDDGVRVGVLGDPARLGPLPEPLRPVPGWAPMYTPQEQALLHRVLARERPAVYWSPHYPAPVAWPAPAVVTVLDLLHLAPPSIGGAQGARRAYAQAMLRWVGRRASAIVVASQFTARELGRWCPRAADRVALSTFGIDERWFDPVEPMRRPRPYALFVGNPKPHKNLPALLDAFELVAATNPDLDLVLAGGGPNRTVDHRLPALRSRLGGRVSETGVIPFEELRRVVAGARVLVQPSLYEGIGLPPLEAMAVGTPVISSGAGALGETCGDAATVCDPASATQLAAAIDRLCRDEAARHEAALRGRRHVRARQASVTPRRAWEAALGARRRRPRAGSAPRPAAGTAPTGSLRQWR